MAETIKDYKGREYLIKKKTEDVWEHKEGEPYEYNRTYITLDDNVQKKITLDRRKVSGKRSTPGVRIPPKRIMREYLLGKRNIDEEPDDERKHKIKGFLEKRDKLYSDLIDISRNVADKEEKYRTDIEGCNSMATKLKAADFRANGNYGRKRKEFLTSCTLGLSGYGSRAEGDAAERCADTMTDNYFRITTLVGCYQKVEHRELEKLYEHERSKMEEVFRLDHKFLPHDNTGGLRYMEDDTTRDISHDEAIRALRKGRLPDEVKNTAKDMLRLLAESS